VNQESAERTPYWWAFLKHPVNKTVALGMLAASVLLSLPMGGDGFGLGLIALAAVQLVGVATVPALASFRAAVDKGDRQAARAARRERLLEEIKTHGGSSHLRSYEQMCLRIASLYRMASDRSSSLTEREVEQLDDVSLDYLRMCLSDAAARGTDRPDQNGALARKLHDVDSRLAADNLSRDDEQQLRQAKSDYHEALARQRRMAARRSALEAALVSTPVRLEEVYQMVMSSPQAGNLSQLLEESVAKLRLAEEAALDIEQALDPARTTAPAQRAAPQAARHAVGQRQ
jgi:hypothetical protein